MDLSCEVCIETYTETGRHVPTLMTCGHTLCSSCIAGLRAMNCPFCRTPFRGRPGDFPKNFTLLQLLQNGSQSGTAKKENTKSDQPRTAKTIKADIERLKQEQKQLEEREKRDKVEAEYKSQITALERKCAEEKKAEQSLTQEVTELEKALESKKQALRTQQGKVKHANKELSTRQQQLSAIRKGNAPASSPAPIPASIGPSAAAAPAPGIRPIERPQPNAYSNQTWQRVPMPPGNPDIPPGPSATSNQPWQRVQMPPGAPEFRNAPPFLQSPSYTYQPYQPYGTAFQGQPNTQGAIPCYAFQRGECNRGDSCQFYHGL